MDWFSVWEPLPDPVLYEGADRVDVSGDGSRLAAWLVLAVIAMAATYAWRRRRVVRHSFWCATAGRDVEARLRCGGVESCSAFDDPNAIACGRRCRDRTFRMQWPPALPVLPRRGTADVV
jgi:hypothetical protein